MSECALHTNYFRTLFKLCKVTCADLISDLDAVIVNQEQLITVNKEARYQIYREALLTVFLEEFERLENCQHFRRLIRFIENKNTDLMLTGSHLKCKILRGPGVAFYYCLPCWMYTMVEKKVAAYYAARA